jgi:hypothetical protein
MAANESASWSWRSSAATPINPRCTPTCRRCWSNFNVVTGQLADFLIRDTLDGLPGAETVRRLSAAVGTHVGKGLNDDATRLLVDFHGSDHDGPDPTGQA